MYTLHISYTYYIIYEYIRFSIYYIPILLLFRSGGQDGPHLVHRFTEVIGSRGVQGEVVNITQPLEGGGGVVGPRPSLHKYSATPDLRIIGKKSQETFNLVVYIYQRLQVASAPLRLNRFIT